MSSGYLWSMMFNRICDSKVSTVAPVISRHSEIQVVCTQRYVQIIRNRFLRLCGHCCYRKFDLRLRAFCLRKSSSRQDLRWSTWTEVWKRRWHHEVRWVNNCQVGLTKLNRLVLTALMGLSCWDKIEGETGSVWKSWNHMDLVVGNFAIVGDGAKPSGQARKKFRKTLTLSRDEKRIVEIKYWK